uniref:Uncharacterized protein n=1 Tax=Sinocyclocheilus anshuiensis TaxID=1608454 RepID=A0A671RSJ0_9TELE
MEGVCNCCGCSTLTVLCIGMLFLLMRMLKLSLSSMQKLVSQMKQDPQNADLKLQLRDLQAKITALSERQVRAAL